MIGNGLIQVSDFKGEKANLAHLWRADLARCSLLLPYGKLLSLLHHVRVAAGENL